MLMMLIYWVEVTYYTEKHKSFSSC